jgi:hypothetical protein
MTALSLKKDSPKKDAEAVVDVMIVHNTKNTLLSLAPAGTLHEARVGISQQTKGTALYQGLPLLRDAQGDGTHTEFHVLVDETALSHENAEYIAFSSDYFGTNWNMKVPMQRVPNHRNLWRCEVLLVRRNALARLYLSDPFPSITAVFCWGERIGRNLPMPVRSWAV